ncbi:hypothetical protein [Haloplanus aerogenes]|uniref:PKD/Chitinase domain-containing protein n=1 Tax=Haloplanus aerogenes TaxID=660522 RepID=A0A3M0DTZ2_9EURY|nr:hypothetical protein [Haloplanus aerogenes]AZH25744.1 hypothetical protein DU502_10285 [Haloplanus aerogenes]RMB25479.1 hypothetical protein ATH50_0571 [Haloplanus aerogenes]
MNPPTDDETDEDTHRDGSTASSRAKFRYWGSALVLLTLIGVTTFGASPVVGAGATNDTLYGGDVEPTIVFATNTDPVARCTVSETSVQVGESVTIDASDSENADDFQYDKYGNEAFGEYTTQSSRVVEYSEAGTYDPQVKVWSYNGGETSDVAACGSITVNEATPTPTPTPTATPTPAPSAVAKCTVSETSVQVGESVTIDASDSENVDDYQYDKYGDSSFGEFTSQSSRSVSYSEQGTYEPRVKVWSYSGGEDSDVATCGTITVNEATPTPTSTPSAVAKCTVSETSVRVGESVTIDASDSENVDDYQYDRYGGGSFGEFTSQSSRSISYSEPGTYEPRVKVWSYSGGEDSDVAACGTITVTEATPTPTSTPSAVAKCTVSETSVQVGESVTVDASGSENADDYQYDRYGDGSFGDFTTQRSRVIAYSEPGTYEPRVRVWSYSGGEDSDVAACGTISVTEATPTSSPTSTATSTSTATPTSTATSTPTDSEASTPSTGTQTPVSTAATPTSDTTATATDDGAWFQYSPSDPSANDSVRLVAQPVVEQEDVEAHSWDIDGDGTVDQQGRILELPAKTSGETTVTLTIERTNGSTATVTRDVPVTLDLDGETATPEQPATGAGGGPPITWLVGLLLVILVAAVVAWSRMDR